MKKTIASLLCLMLILTTILPAQALAPGATVAPSGTPSGMPSTAQESLKGVWVSSVFNLDYPKKATTSVEVLKVEADAILDKAKGMGLNAVFLQIRPTGDALYASKQFPWSKYLTGTQGLAPQDGFDPLSYWVEAAHKRGIELHAWLNPYRIINDTVKSDQDPFAPLSDLNPAKINRSWVVRFQDGKLYYNPGLPEVRKIIIDEVVDIVSRYDIDGIHFDDYFYPGKDFGDAEAYKVYGNGLKLEDWRRENVNMLIREVNSAIKKTRSDLAFGVSPFGIWANKSSSTLGSDTQGNESYYNHYADSRKWVQEGIVDYIMPQIYWNVGYTIADYAKLLDWWQAVVKGTSVKLYIGLAAYRTGNTDVNSAWYGDSEILKQLLMNRIAPLVQGSVFFRYSSFTARPSLAQLVTAFYATPSSNMSVENQSAVTVTMPSKDMSTTLTSYYVAGLSDPRLTLYLNGVPVLDRSPRGYFGTYVKLQPGVNTLMFSQGSKSFIRTITQGKVSTATSSTSSTSGTSAAALKPIIVTSSTYPQKPEVWTSGEKVVLSCVAPVGSAVTATIGGVKVTLKPKSTAKAGTKVVHTQFSATYTLPAIAAGTKIQNLGSVTYSMLYKGTSKTEKSPSQISLVTKDAPYYAEVTVADVDTYFYADSTKGSAYLLGLGMRDNLTAMTSNGYVRLGSGKWIKASTVKTFVDPQLGPNSITKATYTVGTKADVLHLEMSTPAAVSAALSAGKIAIDIANTPNVPSIEVPQGALLTSAISTVTNNRAQLTFNVAANTNNNNTLLGYYVQKSETGLGVDVVFKRKPLAQQSNTPLAGISIMIDPGHGGKDTGALGLLGAQYAEKHINLDTSLKLRDALLSLGATVYMTRESDIDLSLNDRLRKSYQIKPDLFISMHANSIGPEKNISSILGFSVHYKDDVAKNAANQVLNTVISNLQRKSRGTSVDNFYVVRGTWAPSMLLETGFVPNPIEFDWLTNANEQDALAKQIANGILAYFRQ